MNRSHRDDFWLTEFRDVMAAHSSMPFEWGVHDCATIAAKVVALSRDIELATWKDARTALKLVKERSLLSRSLDILGDPIPWGSCIIGDIAIARQAENEAMPQVIAVFDGSGFLVPAARGFMRLDESVLLLGWRM